MTLRGASVAVRMAAWVALLNVLPLRTALRLMDTKKRGAKRVSAERLAAIADGIFRRADRGHRSCWKRAAVLRRYLLLNGIETAVVFGVRNGEETLAGHAWLERDGRPFLEAAQPDYVVTLRYPS